MKRLKSTETTLSTRAEFEAAVDEICKLQLDREQRVTLRDRILLEIQEEHNPEIEAISQDISAKLLLCEKYATTHRETLFGKLKSAAASLGIYGFRTGNPTLALLSRKWKWTDVLAALKATGQSEKIRTKEEPDKDQLKMMPEAELAQVGCRIVQAENFFIEPKRETPDRITA